MSINAHNYVVGKLFYNNWDLYYTVSIHKLSIIQYKYIHITMHGVQGKHFL